MNYITREFWKMETHRIGRKLFLFLFERGYNGGVKVYDDGMSFYGNWYGVKSFIDHYKSGTAEILEKGGEMK